MTLRFQLHFHVICVGQNINHVEHLPGTYREDKDQGSKSKMSHKPAMGQLVPSHIFDLCLYVSYHTKSSYTYKTGSIGLDSAKPLLWHVTLGKPLDVQTPVTLSVKWDGHTACFTWLCRRENKTIHIILSKEKIFRKDLIHIRCYFDPFMITRTVTTAYPPPLLQPVYFAATVR